MDVAREFKEIDFNIKMQIRRQALEATAKIYNMTPAEYAAKLDAERAAEVAAAYADSAYQFGVMVGNRQRAWNEAAESMARGIRAALGR
jgi:predicted HAD superfamily Cof-like phosphohydrolase